MDIEEITRYFLAEPNKTLDFEGNPQLEWREDDGGNHSVRARVVSAISLEYEWFVRVNPRVPDQTHVGLIYQESDCVFRLDVNDSHRNPRDPLRHGTHLHRPFTMTHKVSIADFLDGVPEATWLAANWFLQRANIVEIPREWWSDLPIAPPPRTLFGGR